MSRKRLTLLVSTVCVIALLAITVVPAVASSPKPPKAQFAAVLEQLTGEGVITPEQAEAIMERAGPIFGRIGASEHAYQKKVKELAIARSKPTLLRISQALDMKPDELLPQLREGNTIAQIAEKQGIPTTTVVDELLVPVKKGLDRAVANGKLSQEQAEENLDRAEAKITEMVQEATIKEIVGHQAKKIRTQDKNARRTKAALYQVCQIVDLDREELLAQLKEGKKIAEIAWEQGVSRDELLGALVDRAQERLDKAVSEGKLDEGKVAEIMPKIEERLAKFVDNFPPGR